MLSNRLSFGLSSSLAVFKLIGIFEVSLTSFPTYSALAITSLLELLHFMSSSNATSSSKSLKPTTPWLESIASARGDEHGM